MLLSFNMILAGIYSIDVCPNNYNLLAYSTGKDAVMIFDRRKGMVVKEFEKIHTGTLEENFQMLLFFIHFGQPNFFFKYSKIL